MRQSPAVNILMRPVMPLSARAGRMIRDMAQGQPHAALLDRSGRRSPRSIRLGRCDAPLGHSGASPVPATVIDDASRPRLDGDGVLLPGSVAGAPEAPLVVVLQNLKSVFSSKRPCCRSLRALDHPR